MYGVYAIVDGAAHRFGLQSCLRDLGIEIIELPVVVESDSNAARSFASSRELGKQRHVQIRYLWIQQRVVLTKVVPEPPSWKQMTSMGLYISEEASAMQKGLQK